VQYQAEQQQHHAYQRDDHEHTHRHGDQATDAGALAAPYPGELFVVPELCCDEREFDVREFAGGGGCPVGEFAPATGSNGAGA